MLVAGHQPNYLPYLGFFHKVAFCDAFMIVDTVQFVKRGTFGWMHRNKIRTHEGWQWLSLPVITKGRRHQTCAEAELQNQQDWRRKHWSAIEFHYAKASHFEDYAEPFAEIYDTEWSHQSKLASALIKQIAASFGINTPISVASEENVGGEAHQLLENICKHYGAERYLSGRHGEDYLDLDDMRRRSVSIEFQHFSHPIYQQCQPGEFQAGMCALDLLFNAGPDAKTVLMGS